MKTKVVAFRLTEREYDAVLLAATKRGQKIGDYVREALVLNYLTNQLDMERKRLEAKAKRAANKAAKEAAANGNA
jgi:uncharacterized protein (DUF1778 family)